MIPDIITKYLNGTDLAMAKEAYRVGNKKYINYFLKKANKKRLEEWSEMGEEVSKVVNLREKLENQKSISPGGAWKDRQRTLLPLQKNTSQVLGNYSTPNTPDKLERAVEAGKLLDKGLAFTPIGDVLNVWQSLFNKTKGSTSLAMLGLLPVSKTDDLARLVKSFKGVPNRHGELYKGIAGSLEYGREQLNKHGIDHSLFSDKELADLVWYLAVKDPSNNLAKEVSILNQLKPHQIKYGYNTPSLADGDNIFEVMDRSTRNKVGLMTISMDKKTGEPFLEYIDSKPGYGTPLHLLANKLSREKYNQPVSSSNNLSLSSHRLWKKLDDYGLTEKRTGDFLTNTLDKSHKDPSVVKNYEKYLQEDHDDFGKLQFKFKTILPELGTKTMSSKGEPLFIKEPFPSIQTNKIINLFE